MFNHKCQKCGEPATTLTVRVEKGQVLDYYLCDEHAAEMSKFQSPKAKSPLSEILEGLLKQSEGLTSKPGETPVPPGLRCTSCHLDFEAYRKSLMLGCSECYRSFHDQLIPYLRRIHGDIRHYGRRPGGGSARPPLKSAAPMDMGPESASPLPKAAGGAGGAAVAPSLMKNPLQSIDDLTRSMQKAIAEEDYTKAAHCRDMIRVLKESMARVPPGAK